MSESSSPLKRLGVALQHVLPQRTLTALAHRISTSRSASIRSPLMAGFQRVFDVDLDEAEVPEDGFDSFNAFFTRALKPGVRPLADAALVCPCDGTLSQAGPIDSGGRIVQAKGRDYSIAELLTDEQAARDFEGGRFATIYLAPYDYHRVHVPCDATLVKEIRVPGRLFSVSDATSQHIDRLFARNERMVALFQTEHGPLAVVMVAAMLVAGIETVWDPALRLRPASSVESFDVSPGQVRLAAGQEMGRFHWGSTVILLTGRNAPEWVPDLAHGRRMRLGEALTSDPSPDS